MKYHSASGGVGTMTLHVMGPAPSGGSCLHSISITAQQADEIFGVIVASFGLRVRTGQSRPRGAKLPQGTK
jgi:hypothetical protein